MKKKKATRRGRKVSIYTKQRGTVDGRIITYHHFVKKIGDEYIPELMFYISKTKIEMAAGECFSQLLPPDHLKQVTISKEEFDAAFEGAMRWFRHHHVE